MVLSQNSKMYSLQVFIPVIVDSPNSPKKTKNNLSVNKCDCYLVGRKACSHNGPLLIRLKISTLEYQISKLHIQ